MKSTRALILVVFCLVPSGCFRTMYTNVVDPTTPPAGDAPAASVEVSSWQHFFLFGLVPEEKSVDAKAICGSSANVERIETKRTFLEGLVAAVAGFYINIYSPFDGKVVCKN